jgi:hypothetical protein
MTVPPNSTAASIASADLPLPVGPATIRTGWLAGLFIAIGEPIDQIRR